VWLEYRRFNRHDCAIFWEGKDGQTRGTRLEIVRVVYVANESSRARIQPKEQPGWAATRASAA